MKHFYTLLVLLPLLLTSCSKNDDDSKIAESGPETLFSFIVKNSEGQNLLNPETPDTYNTDQIRIFQVENGETVEINDPMLDAQYGYLITTDIDSVFRMRPYLHEEGLDRTAYIKWNDTDTDTLQLHIEQINQTLVLKKIWYNGEKKFDEDAGLGANYYPERRFVVEKP